MPKEIIKVLWLITRVREKACAWVEDTSLTSLNVAYERKVKKILYREKRRNKGAMCRTANFYHFQINLFCFVGQNTVDAKAIHVIKANKIISRKREFRNVQRL